MMFNNDNYWHKVTSPITRRKSLILHDAVFGEDSNDQSYFFVKINCIWKNTAYLAIPRSPTLMTLLLVRKIFWVLRSRCMIFLSCIYCNSEIKKQGTEKTCIRFETKSSTQTRPIVSLLTINNDYQNNRMSTLFCLGDNRPPITHS